MIGEEWLSLDDMRLRADEIIPIVMASNASDRNKSLVRAVLNGATLVDAGRVVGLKTAEGARLAVYGTVRRAMRKHKQRP